MKFITAEEASKRWKIGLRTVQRMCLSGKIEGAEKNYNIWMIPENAQPDFSRKTKLEVTKEEILRAYDAFVSDDYSNYIDFFSKNNSCKTKITKAYYSAFEAYRYFPQIDKMTVFWKKAKSYLEGTDLKIPEISLTMGSYFTLAIFLTKTGTADECSNLISEIIPLYESITGRKSGLDLLFRAELAFQRGNIQEAELLAYKAVFTQDMSPDVKLGISFILAHTSIHKGDVEGWKRAIEIMNGIQTDNEIMKASVEVAKSELLLAGGFTERIPKWIKQADFSEKKLTVTSKYDALFVHLSYLWRKKEYARAVAFSDMLLETAEEQCFVSPYSLLYLYTIMSVCYSKLFMETQCIDCLKKALDIAKPDGLFLPFAEYFELIGEAGTGYIEKFEPDIYLRVLEIKEGYKEKILSIQAALSESGLTECLTDREKEIAKLIAEGMSNVEIAEQLYISKSTVNYHIQNIYNKLGVNRRSMMIKMLYFNDNN